MATSSVEICNSALVKIGAARIGSLSDDTKAAKICNEQYDKLRKKLLRSHPWNFALARVALADTGNTPSYDYTNEFALASDVLRVLETDLLEGSAWEIEQNGSTRVLLCNSDSVKIKYIKDITDTTIFSSDFEEALSFLLAADLAYALTNSRSLAADMYRAYKAEVAEARSFDAQEHGRQELEANTWIDERY
jgi:hypothetical protein